MTPCTAWLPASCTSPGSRSGTEQRKIIYSTDSTLIGHGAEGEPSAELGEALEGATASEVISNRGDVEKQNRALVRRFGDLLEVYTPIRAKSTGKPVGAFELYIPYAPVAAAIAHDTHRLYLVLVIGLTVLYGVLFRLVASASRELRRRADELKEHAERSAHDACHDPLTAPPEPQPLPRPRAPGDPGERAPRAQHRAPPDRPRPVQGDQRHARPSLGRSPPARGRPAPAPRAARVRHRRPFRRRRVRDPAHARLRPGAAEEVARAVHRALEEPFAIQGLTLDVEASIGIALHPHARVRLRGAHAARRRRDVPRQGQAVGLRGLRPERGRVRRDQAQAGERAAPGDRTATSSSCTTSRRPTCARGGSSAPRRSCAGAIPATAS